MAVHTIYELKAMHDEKWQNRNRKIIEMDEVEQFGKLIKQYRTMLNKVEAIAKRVEREMRSEEYQRLKEEKLERRATKEIRKRERSEARDKRKQEKRDRKVARKAARPEPIVTLRTERERPESEEEESEEEPELELGGEIME